MKIELLGIIESRQWNDNAMSFNRENTYAVSNWSQ